MRLLLTMLLAGCSIFAQMNTLSPQEKSDGWILLFDGKSLNGWTQGDRTTWHEADGALVADSGESLNLRSDDVYADFILKIDFRTGPEGNSGVFLRSTKEGRPDITGYELQIWNKSPTFPTGGFVNHFKATPVEPTPDQWHSYEVQAKGNHFVVKLDGETVLDVTDDKSKEGYIYLQYNKGRPIQFRNIRLKSL